MVTLAIQDDGIGISEAEPGGRVGHGMDNLQRRVEEMDGTLQLSTTPGVGTRIEVTVPAGGEE
jgi:signal transduction histidine kinase